MNIKLGKAHKLSRRMTFRGLDVSIETDKGELRHWYDPHNKTKGSTKMSHPYGYIRRTKGVDGDHVDVYVGPKEDAPNVFVVHQMKAPNFKTYDEDKCMLGFESAADAKAAYLKNFDSPKFFGSMTTMPWAEFEKKVKATCEQPKKLAFVNRLLPQEVTLESSRNPAAEQLLDTAGTIGAAATVPAAGAWYAGRKATQALPNYELINPELEQTAKKFQGLAQNKGLSAGEFTQQYIRHGQELAGSPAVKLPSGETLTGKGLIERLRTGKLSGPLVEKFTGTPYTPKSMEHYKAFEKGVVPAYAQMAQEAYETGISAPKAGGGEHLFKGKGGLAQDFATTVGEARYEAAKELADTGKLHPTRFRQKLVEVMQRKMPNATPADVKRFVQTLEGQLLSASPDAYKAHLGAIRAGQDATHLQNKLLSQAGLTTSERSTSAHEVTKRLQRFARRQGITERLGKLPPEVQQKLLTQLTAADDPLMQMLNMRIRQGWAKAPQQYGSLINPLLGYKKTHGKALEWAKKLRGRGRTALLAGGGLAALPILSRALRGPETMKIKTSADQSAYTQGSRAAFEKLGLLDDKPSLMERAAPWLGATGAGTLGYALLRRYNPAAQGSALRALQNLTKGKKFQIATEEASPLTQRIRSAIFGAPTVNKGKDVGGVVLHHTPSPARGMGDVNIGQGGLTSAMHDKYIFDRVMREGVGAGPGLKGALPDTELLAEALKRTGGNPAKLKEMFPEGFFIKAREGSMGRGIYTSLEDKGVREALQNPNRFIIQRKMPIQQEYRVHTLEGQPFASTHRWIPHEGIRKVWNRLMGGGGGAFLPATGKTRRELEDFVQQATKHLRTEGGKPLASAGESMHAAYDVAKLKDGTYKLIEANPVPGTLMNPIIAQRLQRQAMGRWSRPVAAAGGLGLAVPAGVGVSAATPG